MNQQSFVFTTAAHYKLEPGDGTCYRFWIEKPPEQAIEAYILDSGLGREPENYIFIGVKMPAGCGYGCVQRDSLREDDYLKHINNYLGSHGWEHVNPYTARAVLLAASVLVFAPTAIKEAAAKMLRAAQP